MPYSWNYYFYNFSNYFPPQLFGLVVKLFVLWLIYVFLRGVFGGKQPSPRDNISRWQGTVPTLEEKPGDFYDRFAARARIKLDRPDLPLHKLSFGSRKLLSTCIFPRSIFSM